MRRVEPESEFRFLFFGGTPKNTTTPLALVGWLYGSFLLASSNSRISLSFPTLPSLLIALGIAFARCCIRRWPCLYVCILYLASPPALRGLLGLFPIGINQSDPRGAAGFIAIYTPATPIRNKHRGGTSVFCRRTSSVSKKPTGTDCHRVMVGDLAQ